MTKYTNCFIKTSSVFLLSLMLFVAVPVFAAEIRLDANKSEINSGEQFLVDVIIHSEESLNAVEGRLAFPQDLLLVKEIRDGNSVINFWVEKPYIDASGVVLFSGITPGGFSGANSSIFSVVFEAKNDGVASIVLDGAKVLRNDGTGSQAILTVVPFEMVISQGTPAKIPVIQKIKDTEVPESFVPEISKDESIVNGKWFVVFATQDKGSGIDYYEVKESRQKILTFFSRWRVAESLYILQDQELRSYVFVKAVDKAGNERIVEIDPQNPLGWYENYENWIIIILGVVIAIFMAKKLWRKKRI